MYADVAQTLSYARSRAVFQSRDISKTSMRDFLKRMKSSQIKGSENIEDAAVGFYLSNHGFHLIEGDHTPTESLPFERSTLVNAHVARASQLGLRMFYYVLTISAEEAAFGVARNERFADFVENSTSKDAAKWLAAIMSRKSYKSVLAEGEVGNATLGECIKALELCFRFAQWSGGFGGLPWAQIAETAGEVVRGTNSLELMVDKAFTLCHNNGAIFNKGHQFTHYRHDFYTILDIQASGQIPAAIASKSKVSGMQSSETRKIYESFRKEFPTHFSVPYDGSLVKNMESVRAKKAADAAKKAAAFVGAGGGWATAAAPAGPPKRACDDLLSVDDLTTVFGKGSTFGF